MSRNKPSIVKMEVKRVKMHEDLPTINNYLDLFNNALRADHLASVGQKRKNAIVGKLEPIEDDDDKFFSQRKAKKPKVNGTTPKTPRKRVTVKKLKSPPHKGLLSDEDIESVSEEEDEESAASQVIPVSQKAQENYLAIKAKYEKEINMYKKTINTLSQKIKDREEGIVLLNEKLNNEKEMNNVLSNLDTSKKNQETEEKKK